MTDPYSPEIGFSMGKVAADVVSASQRTPHHSFFQAVEGNPRKVEGPGEYEVADVLIAGIATETQPGKGPTNTAYVYRLDDLAVCHLGNLQQKLTDKQVEEIGSIDVLMVPVGGRDSLGPTEAADVVSQLEPSVVIPMHYRLGGDAGDGLEPVQAFFREMGKKDVVPEAKLSVTRGSSGSEVRLVLLEPKCS